MKPKPGQQKSDDKQQLFTTVLRKKDGDNSDNQNKENIKNKDDK